MTRPLDPKRRHNFSPWHVYRFQFTSASCARTNERTEIGSGFAYPAHPTKNLPRLYLRYNYVNYFPGGINQTITLGRTQWVSSDTSGTGVSANASSFRIQGLCFVVLDEDRTSYPSSLAHVSFAIVVFRSDFVQLKKFWSFSPPGEIEFCLRCTRLGSC